MTVHKRVSVRRGLLVSLKLSFAIPDVLINVDVRLAAVVLYII